MQKNILVGVMTLLTILAVVLLGCQSPTSSTVCTQDVKECPDGSYVQRTGANCSFPPCPQNSTIINLKTNHSIKTFHYQQSGIELSTLRSLDVDAVILPSHYNLSSWALELLEERDILVMAELHIQNTSLYSPYLMQPIDRDFSTAPFWNETWQAAFLEHISVLAQQGYGGVVIVVSDSLEKITVADDVALSEVLIDMVVATKYEALEYTDEFYTATKGMLPFYETPRLQRSVDGVLVEDVWFENMRRRDASTISQKLQQLRTYESQDIDILVVEYLTQQGDICNFYTNCKSKDFACSVTNTNLDRDKPLTCS